MRKQLYLIGFFFILFLIPFRIINAENNLIFTKNLWNLYQNQGVLDFSDDQKISMSSSGYIQTYPFATSSLNLPAYSNFDISFIISFPKITPWGVGLRLGNLLAENNIPANDFNNYISQNDNFSKLINFQVWQDTTNKFHIWYCPDVLNANCVLNPNANLITNQYNKVYNKITNDKYKIRLLKINTNLKVFIENKSQNSPEELLFESTTNRIPQYILLGNNIQFPDLVDYTSLTIEKPQDSSTVFDTKLILLPGFFGSWNKEALLHNKQTDPSDWKLNPIVTEYDGIINSLKNIGLVENNDFYVYAYDWRKPLNDSAIALNDFINTNIPDANIKVNLLGHSEGGQVARVFAQKFGTDKIDKLVTVGSPFKGSAIAYKGVEGGELDSSSPLDFVGKKIMLQLNKKNKLESDRVTLNTTLPILKDLLPTYDYLKDSNNNPIPVNSMSIKNDTVLAYEPLLPNIFSKLTTFYGEKGDTLFGHVVGPRTLLDQLYDLYPDGHPINNLYEIGDETIVAQSANAGTDSNVLVEKNHGEIVTDILPIKQMFTKLGLSYQDGQIVAGKSTALFPGLLFLVQSPATMRVTHNTDIFNETDGMIFIPNAQSGEYTLDVIGQDYGDYTVNIGQFVQNEIVWNEVNGTITNPNNQTDSYSITFDNSETHPFIINQNDPSALFDILINELIIINQEQQSRPLLTSIDSLMIAKEYFINKDTAKLSREMNGIHRLIFHSFRKIDNKNIPQLLEAVNKFENLYEVTLNTLDPAPPINRLDQILSHYKSVLEKNNNHLLTQKENGKNISLSLLFMSSAQDKFDRIQEAKLTNNYRYIAILIESIGQLISLSN